jgi:hypothetical protein
VGCGLKSGAEEHPALKFDLRNKAPLNINYSYLFIKNKNNKKKNDKNKEKNKYCSPQVKKS